MYVSPAVRSMQDDPIEGETVQLLLEAESEDGVEELAAAVAETPATVADRRRFGTLAVDVPQTAIGAVLALDGIDVVETNNAATIDADGAGEDVEFEP